MTTTTKARTANEVANLFFIQKLEDIKSRVARWQREFVEALSDDDQSAANLKALYLYDTCIDGRIDTTISHRQGVWLYKVLAQEKRWNKRASQTVLYQGHELGSWSYQGATSRDPLERMTFRIDPAFLRDYTGVDLALLEQAKRIIEEDEA